MPIKVKMPDSATINKDGVKMVQYFKNAYQVEKDGTIEAPRWLVPDLLARGGVRVDGIDEKIDVRAELEAVDENRPHEIHQFLDAHGQSAHYYERDIHPLSDEQRAKGEDLVADELDRLHQAYHREVLNNHGQITIPPLDVKKAHALAIHDAIVSGGDKPREPWCDHERKKARVEKARERMSKS